MEEGQLKKRLYCTKDKKKDEARILEIRTSEIKRPGITKNKTTNLLKTQKVSFKKISS